MRKLITISCIFLILSAVGGCVYQANISQGNLFEQEELEQIKVGMTSSQVRFLLGTPMVDDPFHKERWDYIYFLKIGRGDAVSKRWLSIYFDGDNVTKIINDQELNPNL